MNNIELPQGWQVDRIVNPKSIGNEPPQPENLDRIALFGMFEEEERLMYTLPSSTPIAEIVKFFSVGLHGANSYGYDPEETLLKVTEFASAIVDLIPSRCFFADNGSLSLRFLRSITDSELNQIEELIAEDNVMQLGLEGYLSEWDGESRLLQKIQQEGCIDLWWD